MVLDVVTACFERVCAGQTPSLGKKNSVYIVRQIPGVRNKKKLALTSSSV
jgi:hypothetical protein